MTIVSPSAIRLRTRTGSPLDVAAERWLAPAGDDDTSVLARARGPVLDVGCGPGRHVVALAERGVAALGIDVTPGALDTARSRGVSVLHRSVFDRVPGAGRWASALLLDGNIGLDADPITLLRRVGSLLHPHGLILAEFEPPGTPSLVRTVRLEVDRRPGPWFRLSTVSFNVADHVAGGAGLHVDERWSCGDRWFALLHSRPR